MALWVGIWTPEDVIDRETRVLTRRGHDFVVIWHRKDFSNLRR